MKDGQAARHAGETWCARNLHECGFSQWIGGRPSKISLVRLGERLVTGCLTGHQPCHERQTYVGTVLKQPFYVLRDRVLQTTRL